MRFANKFKVAMGGIALSVTAVTIGSMVLDRVSSAQAPGQRVPAQLVQPGAGQQALPPTPVLDVPGLMQLFNKPLYMSLKEKMAQQPANAEQWNDLMGKGLQAAEIANLVALRRVEASKEQWLRGAADLQRASIALADAAKAQQWEATVQAYHGLVQRCNNCHQAQAPDKAPQLRP